LWSQKEIKNMVPDLDSSQDPVTVKTSHPIDSSWSWTVESTAFSVDIPESEPWYENFLSKEESAELGRCFR
jgi:hypothetical protein